MFFFLLGLILGVFVITAGGIEYGAMRRRRQRGDDDERRVPPEPPRNTTMRKGG